MLSVDIESNVVGLPRIELYIYAIRRNIVFFAMSDYEGTIEPAPFLIAGEAETVSQKTKSSKSIVHICPISYQLLNLFCW